MGRVESPACNCGFVTQDLNHLFWACPLFVTQREKLYRLLRSRNLQDPFSVEYLLENIDKILLLFVDLS